MTVSPPAGRAGARGCRSRPPPSQRSPPSAPGRKSCRVDPDFGSTLTASNRDSRSNYWVNWKIMGQPCEFQVPQSLNQLAALPSIKAPLCAARVPGQQGQEFEYCGFLFLFPRFVSNRVLGCLKQYLNCVCA